MLKITDEFCWEETHDDWDELPDAPDNNWQSTCGEYEPNGDWVCDRDAGHPGNHVAISDEKVVASWDPARTSWEADL